MKLVSLVLFGVFICSTVYAENKVYLRKVVAGPSVSADESAMFRGAIAQALGTQSDVKVVKKSGEADFAVRGTIEKNANGFNLKLATIKGSKITGETENNVPNLSTVYDAVKSMAAKALAANQVVAGLPDKTVSVVASAEPNIASDQAVAVGGQGEAVSVESKKPNFIKNWFVGLGPVWSTSLLPGVNPSTLNANTNSGTKYDLTFAYVQGLSERWDLRFFYDSNFNSATQGSTGVSFIGAGLTFYPSDRGAKTSLFVDLDAGYGGGNRSMDDSGIVSLGLGFEFFRTRDFSFSVGLHHTVVATTTGTNLPSYPSLDALRFGVFF